MKLAVNFWQIVKRANRNFLSIALGLFLLTTAGVANTTAEPLSSAGKSNPNAETSLAPSVSFKKLWIEYNITQGGVKGMRIHTSFDAHNMKGIAGYLALFFQDNNGNYLMDKNNSYLSGDGEVAAYYEINPGYNPTTVYDDVVVFMPYTELDLPDGKYALKVKANVIYKEGGIIGTLTTYNFDYTQGTPVSTTTTTKSGSASATLQKIWIDYDVTQGGQRGMRVHVNFTVVGIKGIPARLAVFIQKKDGEKIYTSNRAFRSADRERSGEMVVYFDINPGYDRTAYDDLDVFLPYKELEAVLPRGTYDLQVDADVVYKNGDLLQHLALEDFWFERN